MHSRFPRLSTLLVRVLVQLWGLLPPRSRLRRTITGRYARIGFDALNRGNLEAAHTVYLPQVELVVPPQLVALGFDPRAHGREERLRFQRRWMAEWGEFRFGVEEVIDLGERVLVLGRVTGSGLSSGAAFDDEWADIFTFSGGGVIREQAFFDHGEALEAAGLRE